MNYIRLTKIVLLLCLSPTVFKSNHTFAQDSDLTTYTLNSVLLNDNPLSGRLASSNTAIQKTIEKWAENKLLTPFDGSLSGNLFPVPFDNAWGSQLYPAVIILSYKFIPKINSQNTETLYKVGNGYAFHKLVTDQTFLSLYFEGIEYGEIVALTTRLNQMSAQNSLKNNANPFYKFSLVNSAEARVCDIGTEGCEKIEDAFPQLKKYNSLNRTMSGSCQNPKTTLPAYGLAERICGTAADKYSSCYVTVSSLTGCFPGYLKATSTTIGGLFTLLGTAINAPEAFVKQASQTANALLGYCNRLKSGSVAIDYVFTCAAHGAAQSVSYFQALPSELWKDVKSSYRAASQYIHDIYGLINDQLTGFSNLSAEKQGEAICLVFGNLALSTGSEGAIAAALSKAQKFVNLAKGVTTIKGSEILTKLSKNPKLFARFSKSPKGEKALRGLLCGL